MTALKSESKSIHEKTEIMGQILVKNTMTRKSHIIEANSTETILVIKQRVQQKTGILPSNQMLIYAGKQLRDEDLLGNECDIITLYTRTNNLQNLAGDKEKSISENTVSVSTILEASVTSTAVPKPSETPKHSDSSLHVQSNISLQTEIQSSKKADENVKESKSIHADSEKKAQVFVKNVMFGNTYTIDANHTDTVAIIKERIHKKTGILPSNQMLTYAGRQLVDTDILGKDCDKINLLVRKSNQNLAVPKNENAATTIHGVSLNTLKQSDSPLHSQSSSRPAPQQDNVNEEAEIAARLNILSSID